MSGRAPIMHGMTLTAAQVRDVPCLQVSMLACGRAFVAICTSVFKF